MLRLGNRRMRTDLEIARLPRIPSKRASQPRHDHRAAVGIEDGFGHGVGAAMTAILLTILIG